MTGGDQDMCESGVDGTVGDVVIAVGVAAWLHHQAYQALSSKITWSSV